MGVATVKPATQEKDIQQFEKQLLNDVYALEKMIAEGWFKDRQHRMGVEQELCLVDENCKPAQRNIEVLKNLDKAYFNTELARFNLEINADPHLIKGKCFTQVEKQLLDLIKIIRAKANSLDLDVIMAGILPTIRKHDLDIEHITPSERYYALIKALSKLRGGEYEIRIQGLDELVLKHDTAFLEAATTSFQVHLQVHPDEFSEYYNIIQAIAAPVLASATNSPLLFGKRLWAETRVALFQQTVDTRQTADGLRELPSRVSFGNKWIKNGILEIYREDITKHRILLNTRSTEDVYAKIAKGETPELQALRIHNSTVYRWNRPCYGVSNGVPHIRIENRILPSGPTVIDEVATAAFWYGLVFGIKETIPDITERYAFEDAKSNFLIAARYGMHSTFTWIDGQKKYAKELILNELIPLAKIGLQSKKIHENDIEKYLSVVKNRIEKSETGASWTIDSIKTLRQNTTPEQALRIVTKNMIDYQKKNTPLSNWNMVQIEKNALINPSKLLVEECMSREIFSVQKADITQLAAQMMDWHKIRYVAVENEQGELIGLVSAKNLLRQYSKVVDHNEKPAKNIEQVMIKNPITISPEAKLGEAIELLQKYDIGCIPVVKNKKLVGMLTEQNFMQLASRMIKLMK